MVGLSVLLEARQKGSVVSEKTPQVINKVFMMKSSSSSSSYMNWQLSSTTRTLPLSSGFLDHCFLCKKKLLHGKDIYMYKGDKAFCSVECRYTQILMDEEETTSDKIDMMDVEETAKSELCSCSLAAMKPRSTASSSSSSSTARTNRKGARNRTNGFA